MRSLRLFSRRLRSLLKVGYDRGILRRVLAGAFHDEAGMATAEFALVLPALVLVTGIAISAIGVASMQVRACDAARVSARAVSLYPANTAQPDFKGITVSVTRSGNMVKARAYAKPPGLFGQAVTITCDAVGVVEEDVP